MSLTGASRNLKQLTGLKRNPQLENDRVQHSPGGRRKSKTSEDVGDTNTTPPLDLADVTGHSTQLQGGHILYK